MTNGSWILRGQTAHFVVFYGQSLGANGQTLADAVLATCEADYNRLQGWFSNISILPETLPFRILIQPGMDGARHFGCLNTELFCDAYNGSDADQMRWLVVAEESEVFMTYTGWNCTASNGEALSRVLATELYPKGYGNFATALGWLASDRLDFVNNTDPTDTNAFSNGCGVLFINWLRFQIGYSLNQIVQAGGTTLAETYRRLSGRSNAFQPFAGILLGNFPPGHLKYFDNENPFPLPWSLRGYLMALGLNPQAGLRHIQPPVTSVREFVMP